MLLRKIRELLWTLSKAELFKLEKLLCSLEELSDFRTSTEEEVVSSTSSVCPVPDLDDYVTRFYNDHPNCKQLIADMYSPKEETASPEENEWNEDVGENLYFHQVHFESILNGH
jgi:hypothetical protein